MSNPFAALSKPKEPMPVYDEWEGQFSCDTVGCYKAAHIARYINSKRVLTWKCEDGHISVMENVDE